MRIVLNGKNKKIGLNEKINDLLSSLKIKSKFIAIAVNGEFISKKNYSKTFLNEGDVVEIVSPHPGG